MKGNCIGCKENKIIHARQLCDNCYAKMLRLERRGIPLIKGIRMGLFKPTGTDGNFFKGSSPWNKNLKNPYTEESRIRFQKSGAWFSKGHTPWNKGKTMDQAYADKYKNNSGCFRRGKEHPNWKGGKKHSHHTYRKDVEKVLGRKLESNEIVHHKDGDHSNNNEGNLIIFPSHSEHMKYHWKIQKEKKIKGRMTRIQNAK